MTPAIRVVDAGNLASEVLTLTKSDALIPREDGFHQVCDFDEPGPQEYVVDGLIPLGFPSILFGLGASRKSWLAVFVAFCVALNRSVFGRHVKHGPVLFLDGEMDRATFLRRAYQLARGMGLDRLPEGIYYRRVASLSSEVVANEIASFIEAKGIVLTVIDSWSGCIPVEDVNSADAVLERMKFIADRFGTVLVIDHTKKTSEGDATPFGSVAKMNLSRSVLQLTGTSDGAAVLKQIKLSFDVPVPAIAFTLAFGGDMVCVEQIGIDDARVEEAAHVVPAAQKIQSAFESGRFNSGATAKDIAEELGINQKTVQNKLLILSNKNVTRRDGTRWFPSSPSLKGTWGTGNGESPASSPGNSLGNRSGEPGRLSGRDARGDE